MNEQKELSQREREQNALNAINDSEQFVSRVNMANYEMQHVREGMRNAPKMGIVIGITSFLLLVADLIIATVLLIKGIWIGAIVCAALFGDVIIIAFISTAVSRAIAMNGNISRAKKIIEGKVKTCFTSGTTTVKSGGSHGQRLRVTGVTYRVVVSADGKEYGAFSKRFYETDETITVAVMGKKRAKIVDETEI